LAAFRAEVAGCDEEFEAHGPASGFRLSAIGFRPSLDYS